MWMTTIERIMTNYDRPSEWLYSEKKMRRNVMLTDTASSMIDEVSKELNITRSEVLERAIRCGGLQAAKKFNPETGECCNG